MLLWKLVIPWYGPIAHKVPSALCGLRKRICQRSTALFSFLGKRICQSNIFSVDRFTLLVLFALLCLFFCVPIPLFMAIYERNGIQFIDSNGIANYRQWRWSISWDQSKSISLTNDISNSLAASKHSSLIFSWGVGNTLLSVFFSGQHGISIILRRKEVEINQGLLVNNFQHPNRRIPKDSRSILIFPSNHKMYFPASWKCCLSTITLLPPLASHFPRLDLGKPTNDNPRQI